MSPRPGPTRTSADPQARGRRIKRRAITRRSALREEWAWPSAKPKSATSASPICARTSTSRRRRSWREANFARLGLDPPATRSISLVGSPRNGSAASSTPGGDLRPPDGRRSRPPPRRRARMNPAETLVDILRRRAAEQPCDRAYVFVNDKGGEDSALTYADLHARSEAVAAQLAGAGRARRARASCCCSRPGSTFSSRSSPACAPPASSPCR